MQVIKPNIYFSLFSDMRNVFLLFYSIQCFGQCEQGCSSAKFIDTNRVF